MTFCCNFLTGQTHPWWGDGPAPLDFCHVDLTPKPLRAPGPLAAQPSRPRKDLEERAGYLLFLREEVESFDTVPGTTSLLFTSFSFCHFFLFLF